VLSEKKVKYPRYIRLSTELREMWKQANLLTDSANHRNSVGRKLLSLTIIALLLISASTILVEPGLGLDPPATIKIEPTYIVGRRLDVIEVKFWIYDANYSAVPASDVCLWNVDLWWDPSVLECNLTSLSWGSFMDGPRITDDGLLWADAASGTSDLYVSRPSLYYEGVAVLIKDDLHQETNTVASVVGSKVTLLTPLVYSYTVADHVGAYPDPATSYYTIIDKTLGNLILTGSDPDQTFGATGDGLLATIRFIVKQNANSLLDIDTEFTYIYNHSGEQRDVNKGNGYFVSMQPYDTMPSGIIDVYDLYTLGKNWAKCPQQHKVPTTTSGGWTSGANAYMTDDSRAYADNNAAQVYGGFGFTTTSWSGVGKVEIGVERRAVSLGGTLDDTLKIEVSNNGGSSWSTTSISEVVSWTSDKFAWFDFTGAYAWTPAFVNNIAVRISYVRGSGTEDRMQVDWVTVRVTPTPASSSKYADVNADSIVNTPDLTQLAPQFGTNYLP
jgi:hypothetical protein